MKQVLFFFLNGVMGYSLQAFGYALSIHAMNRKKVQPKTIILLSVIITVLIFGIRNIQAISFGYHTILILIFSIIVSTTIFKTSMYQTTLGVLLCSVAILVFEVLTFGILQLSIGSEAVNEIMKNAVTLDELIIKAAWGIPANIAMVTFFVFLYKFIMKKVAANGKDSQTNS